MQKLIDFATVALMSLKAFLEQRSQTPGYSESIRSTIESWKQATYRLLGRIEQQLEPYPQLDLQRRWVSLTEHSVRYGMERLEISFAEASIAVEPKGAFVPDSRGRVAMSCGAKLVLLDWVQRDEWTYRWSIPRRDDPPQPLTDAAIESLIEELLA